MSKTLVCLGHGYSARAVTSRLHGDSNWTLIGTSRTQDGARRIAETGMRPIIYQGLSPSENLGETIRSATYLLISASPDEAGDPFLRHHRKDIEASSVERICYLSTIGVYGNHEGRWIDETAELLATSPRSKWRVRTEDRWRSAAAACGAAFMTMRLSGIYGPGRSAIDKLRAGSARRIVKPGQVFNRIHVSDIATCILAGFNTPNLPVDDDVPAGDVFNITDDEPAPPQDVITLAAEMMGIDPPPEIPFEEADLGPMARSFYGDVKRVKNERLKDILGVNLQYPTYREGLRGLLAEAA
ncbi:MAG: NAD(P)-dependent oxidoreductase [Pseudomonadota bacterium]